jgi:hypothetical protein
MTKRISPSSWLLILRPLVVASFVLPACCRNQRQSRRWWGRPSSAPSTLLDSNSTSAALLAHDIDMVDSAPSAFCKVINFQSSFTALSDPLPDHVPKHALTSFFDDPSHFSFGPSIPATLVPITPELRQEWMEACQRVGATLPQEASPKQPQHFQRLLSVRAAGFSMLGLTVEWSALMGAQVIAAAEMGSDLPYIEFVLIKDQSEARGRNKPFLWMYNKITGNNNDKDKNDSAKLKRETTFSSRFGFVEHPDPFQNAQQLAFQCTGTMEMLFPIPSIVGRMLGSSSSTKMQNLQRKVNKIITGEIEKDMKKAILHWQDNFQRWANHNKF